MNNPSEIIDTMIEYESQCISKYNLYDGIYSDINNAVSNGTPLNNIIVPIVYNNIRTILPECNNLINNISLIVDNSLTVFNIYEIYMQSNKSEEALNSIKTLEGFLMNLQNEYNKYNALFDQIEQSLIIAKDRMIVPEI